MDGVLLITGGSSGVRKLPKQAQTTTRNSADSQIGFATVKSFLGKGVRKLVVADVAANLNDVIAPLSKEYEGLDALVQTCNVADEGEVKALIAAAVKKFGRIDYAVNCAGISAGAPWADFSSEIWDRTIGVNERGVFLCMREQLKVMAEQEYTR
jgi:NAD(P)-dependent dehydrogenase (short-subunit alcohol dehydrogenase family)